MRICVLMVGLTCLLKFAGAQSEDYVGNWLMAIGQNRLHNRWSLHTEFQWRLYQPLSDVEQVFARGGLNYLFSRELMFTAGYAYAGNYAFGEDNRSLLSEEDRIWQQINLRHDMNKLVIESRFRLEQRWIGSNYLDRVRHRVMLTYRLNGHRKMVRRPLNIIVSDEIFIHATGTPSFDRNRLYAALGYQLSSELQLQVGYLRQAVKDFSKNHLQLGLMWNVDFRETAEKTQATGSE